MNEMHGSPVTLSGTQCLQQVEAHPYLKPSVEKGGSVCRPSCGAYLIILNNSSTYLDVRADSVLQGDAISMLPAIAEQVLYG